jgi:F-type H+-transporting ATPase subunit delta
VAELSTIARPYAEAVFKLAKQGNNFADWSKMLEFTSAISADATMQSMIGDPNVQSTDLEKTFLAVCEGKLNDDGKRMVRVLIDNNRLGVLPAIRDQYELLKAAEQGEVEALVETAMPLNDTQVSDLVSMLKKRFKKEVRAKVTVNAGLIGGVKVTVGDVVIDASVRGRLDQMATTLKQ